MLSVGQVQKLFLDDLTGAHGAIVLRAEPESAFGAGVAPTRKGRIRAFAVSYAGPPRTRTRRQASEGTEASPPTCSLATSRRSTRMMPPKRSATCSR